MTLVTGTIEDISGRPDNTVWVFSSILREEDGTIVSPRYRRADPVAGVLSIDLTPGYAAIAHQGVEYVVDVPTEGPVDLWDLIAAAVAFPPGTPPGLVGQAVLAYLARNPRSGLEDVERNSAWTARNPGSTSPDQQLTYFDKPDAAHSNLPNVFDTGGAMTRAGASASIVSGGGLHHVRGTGGGQANEYNFVDAGPGHLLRRIGVKFKIDPTGSSTSDWAIGLAIANRSESAAHVDDNTMRMGLHFTISHNSYGLTKASAASGSMVFTDILDTDGNVMFGGWVTSLVADNFTEHTVQAWIVGDQIVLALPDGQVRVSAHDSDISTWSTRYGFFQHLMNNKDTSAIPVITEAWYGIDTQHPATAGGVTTGSILKGYATLSDPETLASKTLTTPIIDGILDLHGNVILLMSPLDNSVNYTQMFNSPATGNPVIAPNGTDTNIDYAVEGKGTGRLKTRGSAVVNTADFHAATAKTTPVSADELPLLDSAGSFGLKRVTVSNLKTAVSSNVAAPASASATGVAGATAYDSGFFYVCVATNTWKRVAISTW